MVAFGIFILSISYICNITFKTKTMKYFLIFFLLFGLQSFAQKTADIVNTEIIQAVSMDSINRQNAIEKAKKEAFEQEEKNVKKQERNRMKAIKKNSKREKARKEKTN
jgi:F0F1-type ATP synthase epsilon subunit